MVKQKAARSTRKKLQAEMCKILLRTGAIRFGVFKLSSGKLSPYYIDLRVLPSFPQAFERIISMFETTIRRSIRLSSFDRIAGIPTAGIPFASVLAYRLGKPFLYIRKEMKPHGRERRIEGLLSPGDRVLIVDDLITTGKNVISGVEAIRSEGGVVKGSLVLIDRQEGGRENLEKLGVKLSAFSRIADLARELLGMEAIDEAQYEQIVGQCVKRMRAN